MAAITGLLLTTAGLSALLIGATGSAAFAATTTSNSPTTLSGSQTLSSTGVSASGAGVTATFDLTETLNWTQAAQVTTSFDPNLVRQGRSPSPSDSYATTAPGTMSVTWTLNNLGVSWDGIGPLSLGNPGSSATGSCNLMASGGNYDCNLSSSQISLLDTYPLPGPYVKLGLGADVTISPQQLATVRQAAFSGSNDGTASLTLSETPVTDSLAIPCSVPAGDDLTYTLGNLSATDGISVLTSLVFDVGLEAPNPLPPFNELDASFATPTIPLAATTGTIAMSGPGATFDFGNVLPNNLPPTVSAGGPYSGNEGAPISFDGTGSSDICGFPTLVWDFSDGGVAYGPSPQHTFEAPGVYSGLVTATDATGLSASTTFGVSVANLPPVANAGPNLSTEWGIPVALNGSAVDPGAAEQPFLAYSWNFGDGTPSASGGASVSHTYATPSTYTATFQACDPEAACGTSTTEVVVNERNTVLSYTGAATSDVTDPATLSASLIDDQGDPVVGRQVSFFLDGAPSPFAAAMTNASGNVSVAYPFVLGSVGSHTIVAEFTGDSMYNPSVTPASSFTVTQDGTVLKYTGPLTASPSKALTLSAALTDDAGRPLAGKTVPFTLGSQRCTAVTNNSGVATCTISKLTAKPGSYALGSSFAGDPNYLPSGAAIGFSVK